MAVEAIILLLLLSGLQNDAFKNQTIELRDDQLWEFPHFWTSVGFCPMGSNQHRYIVNTLLHSDAVQLNMRYIAALPAGAVTHIRIHWLLNVLKFVQFTQAGLPIFDFTQLDKFMLLLEEELDLHPVIEFMGNPGRIFIRNPTYNSVLWEDFSHQVARHYLNLFGAKTLLGWRFESWNEPDLREYNRINFTTTSYLEYLVAVRRGLDAAGTRENATKLHFPLRGPAGLFKNDDHHPLCWGLLNYCNEDLSQCPIEVLTYHRKGNGTAQEVLDGSIELLQTIRSRYPNVQHLPLSNDEADPIAGWSTPHPYHEDVRYAAILLDIVLDHWSAKLKRAEFAHFETLSHDNAFLSYHPHEFAQRTLLAHFRMNESSPVHSQFIQKPVYAALGFLAKLGDFASNVQTIMLDNCTAIRSLYAKSKTGSKYYSQLFLPLPNAGTRKCAETNLFKVQLPELDFTANQSYAYIVETLEHQVTDPAFLWHKHGSPSYPNATLRALMRLHQTPEMKVIGLFSAEMQHPLTIAVPPLKIPWALLLRMCSNESVIEEKQQLQKLSITAVTKGEILLTWRETKESSRCLQHYEVWQRKSQDANDNWLHISKGWRLPFPSFQHAPIDGGVNGFYKVRSVNLFNRSSDFTNIVEYIEL